jgi:membrane-associated protein
MSFCLIPHRDDMPHYLDAVAGSPWILAVVFVVAGLDALAPFMPSESTVVACGVAAASTGRPHLALLILAAAAGGFLGDAISFRIGRRSTASVAARLTHGRAKAVHTWVHRMLHSRGGTIVVFARYVPGGRSATALAAGLVGYPSARFHWYTALGVTLWAVQASLIGYLGGAVFADHPVLGFLMASGIALAITGVAIAVQSAANRSTSEEPERLSAP